MKCFPQTTVFKMGQIDRKRWVTLLATLSLVFQCASNPTGHALAAETAKSEPGGRRQAILIGIAEYQNAHQLAFTANDVRQLGLTLRERGGYEVLEIVDTARETDAQTEREAMQAAVAGCLSQLGPNDDVLLYFSGHGFRDEKGRLYLAQIDCDPANPEEGGVPVTWLRKQLADCKAKFKLLIIDACHGGSKKGDLEIVSVTASDLGMPFQNLESVVTLASSQSDEKSLVWYEKRQSLFTYWLNQGLKGHADRNGNSEVTIDELYDYVFDNVTDVAQGHFKRQQTPVRIIRSGTPGVPVLIYLKPHTLKGLLDDMAEQLATAMQFHGLSELGIPEFLVDTGGRELLGGEFGTLGRYCAAELEGCLMRRSGGKFDVVEHDALQEELANKGHAVGDLGTDKMKNLTVERRKVRVLVNGVLRSRNGSLITIQCKLTAPDNRKGLGFAGGTAALNEDEYGMLGRSYDATPIPDAPTVDNPKPRDPIGVVDRASEGAHPMQDPDFPYRVKIMVGDQERKAVFRGNDMFVALSPREVYAIDIENRAPRGVLMRLLVDGRNTLPEKVDTEGLTVALRDAQPICLPAQRVNLSEAECWSLDPSGAYLIQGFFSNLAEDGTGKYNDFVVADAPDSPSVREHFGEEMGMITAAFYAPGGARAMVTESGEEHEVVVGYKFISSVGKQLAVVNIRYVEPEALAKLLDENNPPSTPR